jgi:glutamine synthetase
VAWGEENRETALRLIKDNVEIKCFDLTANPYLVVAGVIAAGLDGIATEAELPEGLNVDPALLGDVQRLPTSLKEAVDEFEKDTVLTEAFGQELAGTIADVRRGEMERYKDASPQGIANVTRWRH